MQERIVMRGEDGHDQSLLGWWGRSEHSNRTEFPYGDLLFGTPIRLQVCVVPLVGMMQFARSDNLERSNFRLDG